MFICEADVRAVAGQVLCPACAARPDASYLEEFRAGHWGKRDGFAWLWGLTVPLNLALLAGALVTGAPLAATVNLALGAGGTFYFLGRPWARGLIFLLPAVTMGGTLAWMVAGATGWPGAPRVIGFAIASGAVALVPAVVAFNVYFDGRNQLFFQVPLPAPKLQKAWDRHANNGAARSGLLLSLAGLVVPGMSVAGLACSIYGLTRVNPTAHPPIGRKGQAVAGIILGALGVVEWGGFLVAALGEVVKEWR